MKGAKEWIDQHFAERTPAITKLRSMEQTELKQAPYKFEESRDKKVDVLNAIEDEKLDDK